MQVKSNLSKTLAESGLLLALAVLLSFVRLAELPYGGSVTPASMLPVLLIALRCGTLWGMLAGLADGLLQLFLSGSVLSYATSWKAAVAIVVLDYLLAFALLGLGGLFRRLKNQTAALLAGTLLACILRYLCHVLSGATVWAGLSIPTSGALVYSLIYNATYLLPETLVTAAAAWYLSSFLNFRSPRLSPLHREAAGGRRVLSMLAGLLLAEALVTDCVLIFPALQNGETGEFYGAGLRQIPWLAVLLVTLGALLLAALLLLLRKKKGK